SICYVKVGHRQAPNKRNPLQQCSGFFVVWDKVNTSGHDPMLHSEMKQREGQRWCSIYYAKYFILLRSAPWLQIRETRYSNVTGFLLSGIK
ncbi:hypothetical protein, partial [Pseudoalteromonas sp. H105]|uniref:hypothetical protein n=1 Tax=Pseudoalteromonas sp. H105 TaxID=1348393 RepID=UPI000AC2D390